MNLLFCTTNHHKFELAKRAFEKHGIKTEQLKLEVDEIQSENPKYILKHKAGLIYEKVKRPVLVSDDSWNIPALKGFPGAYMKQVNHWFTSEDWLNLMASHSDKRIFLESRMAFINNDGITIFEDIQERYFKGTVSENDGVEILKIISIEKDGKHINELWKENPSILLEGRTLWDDFAKWYKQNIPG